MTELPRLLRRPFALDGILIALCAAVGAGLAFTRGQDIDFDQLNYHFYSVYAWLGHRFLQDVAPGQVMHSFFSPFIYFPFYFMVRHWPPRLVGLGLGALQGLNIWLVIVIARIVTPALPTASRIAVIAAALVISLASPMAASELGTSFADLLISIPILAGLALLMQAAFHEGRALRNMATIALAGALLGAATSLKLTGAAYAIGLGAASLIGWRSWRQRGAALLATGAGGIAGFALCGGTWYLLMWRTFGNPVFPYFNAIFRSPDYPSATSLYDPTFLPHSFWEGLLYPFLWLRTQNTTEVIHFRDIRFALLIVLGIAALGIRLGLRNRLTGPTTQRHPSGARLIVFMAVTFLVWLHVWSIQRYLVGIELLLGPAIVVVLGWGGFFEVFRGRILLAAGALCAVVCVASVHSPDWGHIGWRQSWYQVDPPPTDAARPVYLLVDGPLAFTVPEMKPGSSAIDVVNWENIPSWGDTVFLRRIHDIVADPQYGPFWAVASRPIPDFFKAKLALYGLALHGDCTTTRGRPWPLTWCPVVRTAPAAPAAG